MDSHDPLKVLRVCSILDPAIDPARSDLAKYETTRNPSLVHALPGRAIEWFHLRPLTMREMKLSISHQMTAEGRWCISFCLAVVGVENVGGRLSAGLWKPTTPIGNDGRMMVSDDDLELWDGITIDEIGKVAYERASFRRAAEGFYALPPSSAVVLQTVSDRLAAATRATAKTRSSGKHSPEPTLDGSSSDAATDVLAMEPPTSKPDDTSSET